MNSLYLFFFSYGAGVEYFRVTSFLGLKLLPSGREQQFQLFVQSFCISSSKCFKSVRFPSFQFFPELLDRRGGSSNTSTLFDFFKRRMLSGHFSFWLPRLLLIYFVPVEQTYTIDEYRTNRLTNIIGLVNLGFKRQSKLG